MFKKMITGIALAVFAIFGFVSDSFAAESYKIAWSRYTGWEFLGYMQSSGILEKHAKANGVEIELVFVADYVDSITLYASGNYNGVAVTNMDVLSIAGVGGRKSFATIVGDYSFGNDGVILKGFKSLEEAKGSKVYLVEYSVSHYQFARCLQQHGLSMDDFTIENVTDADIPAIVQQGENVVATSWNPMLMQIRNMDGVTVVCDSSQIPGEIIDMVVTGDEVSEAARRALAGAWYEVLAMVQAGDETVIAALADQAGADVDAFKAQLKTTKMFYTPADAVAFVKDNASLKDTMKKVTQISFDEGVYDGVDSPDELGIKFADGTVIGDENNIALTFDPTTMESLVK
jgi:NitT/TauT family transport system substrate-binding protein